MKLEHEHINVLFKAAQPEPLLQRLKAGTKKADTVRSFNVGGMEEDTYRHYARSLDENRMFTEDELIQRHLALSQLLAVNQKNKCAGGIFLLLSDYGKEQLRISNQEFLVVRKNFLDWRKFSLGLGQDLFTCSYLAYKEQHIRGKNCTRNFCWPSILPMDDINLRQLLDKGIAENHFHLNGSTQIFPITWAFLMNHPTMVRTVTGSDILRSNLNSSHSNGTGDNQLSWEQRLYIATWIRKHLFSLINASDRDPSPRLELHREFITFCNLPVKEIELSEQVEIVRQRAALLDGLYGSSCLDYAITPALFQYNKGEFRLLAGERYFLYCCFKKCYQGKLNSFQQDLFYLYLLIKLRFREEMVQANSIIGFRNFSDYNARKNFLKGYSDYQEEAHRLSIAANFIKYNQNQKQPMVQSLEMRIMPGRTAENLKDIIEAIDCTAEYSRESSAGKKFPLADTLSDKTSRYLNNTEENADYFYTLHFAKRPLKKIGSNKPTPVMKPRNHEQRKLAEEQAKALAIGLMENSYLCSRIRGIDGCSHEIGCRPETFGTVFRFLRSLDRSGSAISGKERYYPFLSATYHVGEDFLDLVDGIRSIDEAVCYLNLKSGDRIGHALAMGTDPTDYYRSKGNRIALPRQDLLDNLVWIYFRSLEWDVPISANLRECIQKRAEELLQLIYTEGEIERVSYGDDTESFTLIDYYTSWKLRGDDPDIYEMAMGTESLNDFQKKLNAIKNGHGGLGKEYDRYKIDDRLWEYHAGSHAADKRDSFGLRSNRNVQTILYRYHFSGGVRKKGEFIEEYQLTSSQMREYLSVVFQLQNALMKRLNWYDIAIECNPSSNQLIGSFIEWEKHPMFRFYNKELPIPEKEKTDIQLRISINTDDLGVFDSSLENEYALVYSCLLNKGNSNGEELNSAEVTEYLEKIREMGINMVFPKAQKTN